MLNVFHADELEPLLDALAGRLAAAPVDAFERDVVVVPNAGMKDAVVVGLARRLGATRPDAADGIVANVDLMFPGRFISLALAMPSTAFLAVDPWQLPHLAWPVLDVIRSGEVPSIPVPEGSGERTWALARRIADLFDRYASQREQMLREWADGRDHDASFGTSGFAAELSPEHRWQPQVWRAVARRIGSETPAQRNGRLAAGLAAGDIVPSLPGRVSLFGFGALSPTLFSVAHALSGRLDVAAYLRHHSATAWNAVRPVPELSTSRSESDATAGVAHPLLASWGRPSLEARAVLAARSDVAFHDLSASPSVAPEPRTLLAALQHDIRANVAPALRSELRADTSVQVHTCHGEVRQLESLRDALGHLFVDDPTLEPHDVVVLCPDVARMAPLVQAVLGRGSLPIPVRVGDRALTSDDPMGSALVALLSLVAGRATLTEVVGFVQRGPVRQRLGWGAAEVEQVSSWAAELGVRWGLEAEHRADWDLPADLSTGTWRSLLDRLLAGLAMPAPTPRVVVGHTAPYDDLSAGDAGLVGTFADLVARLVALHDATRDQQPIGDWVELLRSAVDGFFGAVGDDRFLLADLHRTLDEIEAGAEGSTVPIGLADVRDLVADVLSESPGRLSLRSGAVTVSSLVPLAGVPARVVCIVGLDEGSLRAGAFDGDDILGVHPVVGERHPRHESRQLLLDAVLAAGDHLIITCNGADLTTNKSVPLTVALVELLDTVRATVADGDDVVVRHPRHGFHEVALGGTWADGSPLVAGLDGAPFTFDDLNRKAAEERRRRARAEALGEVSSPWLLVAPSSTPGETTSISIDDLVDALARPARLYLSRRLDVRLPSDDDPLDDLLPVSLGPLGSAALGREYLELLATASSTGDWVDAKMLDGTMPPGELGRQALDAVSADVTLLGAVTEGFDVPLRGEAEQVLDLALAEGVRLVGTVTGLHEAEGAVTLVDVRYARWRPSHRLSALVRLAAVQLVRPELECSAVVVARAKDSSTKPPVHSEQLSLVGSTAAERLASARALLDLAHRMWEWSQYDAVPYFDRTSAELVKAKPGDLDKRLESDLLDSWTSLLFGGVTVDDLRDAPALATDPDWLPQGARAVAVAGEVWRIVDECAVCVEGPSIDDESTTEGDVPAEEVQ